MAYPAFIIKNGDMFMDTGLYKVSATAECDADFLKVIVSIGYNFDENDTVHARDLLENVVVHISGRVIASFYDAFQDREIITELPMLNGIHRYQFSISRAKVNLPPGNFELVLTVYNRVPTSVASIVIPDVLIVPRPIKFLSNGKFVRSFFNLGYNQLKDNPALEQEIRDAEINCLHEAAFNNPGDLQAKSYDDWLQAYKALREPAFDWMVEHNWYFLCIGDDFCRTQNEIDALLNNSWGIDTIKYAFEKLASTGKCIGIEMVDEISVDPNSSPIYKILADEAKAAGLSLSWPAPGLATPPLAFESKEYSRHNTRYWTFRDWRLARIDGSGSASQYTRELIHATELLDRTRPFLMLGSATGPAYIKQVEGGDFQFGKDKADNIGMRPEDAMIQTWTIVVKGSAGERKYFYDFAAESRLTAPLGTFLETGSKPGDKRWSGIITAFKSVAQREEILTNGHWYEPFVNESYILGRIGDLRIWINCLDDAQPTEISGVLASDNTPVNAGQLLPFGSVVLSK